MKRCNISNVELRQRSACVVDMSRKSEFGLFLAFILSLDVSAIKISYLQLLKWQLMDSSTHSYRLTMWRKHSRSLQHVHIDVHCGESLFHKCLRLKLHNLSIFKYTLWICCTYDMGTNIFLTFSTAARGIFRFVHLDLTTVWIHQFMSGLIHLKYYSIPPVTTIRPWEYWKFGQVSHIRTGLWNHKVDAVWLEFVTWRC